MYLVAYASVRINLMKNIVQMLIYVKPMSLCFANVVVIVVLAAAAAATT